MKPDTFRKLVALGLSQEQMAGVLEIFEEQESAASRKDEDRRAQGRERWHRWNEKRKQTLANVSQHEQTLANNSRASDARGLDNLQTKNITGQKENKKDSAPKARVDLDAFRDELSPILDPERIEALIAVRRKKGATMTPHAGRLLAKAIGQCPDASAAADEMVLRNWTGIKPEWLESRTTPPRQATSPPKKVTQASMWIEEGRKYGIISDEPSFQSDRRLDQSDDGRSDKIVDLSRRIASA